MLGRVRRVRRRFPAALTLLAAVSAAAGCSSAPRVAVPSPTGEAARQCRALHRDLPRAVDGLGRGTAEPVSDFTAIWGDPAVELRCGVPKPEVLRHGSEHYNPNPDSAEVNGVQWLFEKQDDGYRFTTVLRKVYVEVTVPAKYAPEVNVLPDLAPSIRATIPAGI
ncbi:hypothetical protein ADL22_15445 [Streptomyces sp. NRRL F-4489]|uniref:DUF3515 domain-containing protein n=1 Tax=Streptomyces sp. NRRL F-4489 TaxID=1609095 RepID=UPI000749D153|nr:DUF3515 domain-containing protein [Streptomyces sp. NRRL F-4489]KUL39830.1 hypothetical protein ADL22_15445 [Streptomyces sp. NRRL F-4489]